MLPNKELSTCQMLGFKTLAFLHCSLCKTNKQKPNQTKQQQRQKTLTVTFKNI